VPGDVLHNDALSPLQGNAAGRGFIVHATEEIQEVVFKASLSYDPQSPRVRVNQLKIAKISLRGFDYGIEKVIEGA
jgi:hypothetical protein